MLETFSLETYEPIDYRNWIRGKDEARNGINLRRLGLLNDGEWRVWNESRKWRGSRDDPEQEEIVTRHAITLLNYLPGIREVVGTSAMLHDTGMYNLFTGKEWKTLVDKLKAEGKTVETPEIRLPHEFYGCLIAGRVMDRASYPDETYHRDVALTIGGHDTRILPPSESARIVWASDLLWRVSYPCFESYLFDESPEKILSRCEENALCDPRPNRVLGEPELSIGRAEAANSLYFKFKQGCVDILRKKGYERELKKAVNLYEVA